MNIIQLNKCIEIVPFDCDTFYIFSKLYALIKILLIKSNKLCLSVLKQTLLTALT